ncbi:MAG: hypothetical protein ACRDMH_13120 [Solirubrobacterales bacterium]
MTVGRRIAKLEQALPAKAATLLWLAEAHEFGSLVAYAAWLVEQPASVAPFERVPAQARAATLAALRGQPRPVVWEAQRQAVRDAVFLIELVLRLNSEADEAWRFAGSRHAALVWEGRAIRLNASTATPGRSRPRGAAPFPTAAPWQGGLTSLVAHVDLVEATRRRLEGEYFDGAPTLFPDLADAWQRLREGVDGLAGSRDMIERKSAPRPKIDLRRVTSGTRERGPEEAAWLVDAARAAALQTLGDTEAVRKIAERRLPLIVAARPRIAPTGIAPPSPPAVARHDRGRQR